MNLKDMHYRTLRQAMPLCQHLRTTLDTSLFYLLPALITQQMGVKAANNIAALFTRTGY